MAGQLRAGGLRGGRRRLRRAGAVVGPAAAPRVAHSAHPPGTRPPSQVGQPVVFSEKTNKNTAPARRWASMCSGRSDRLAGHGAGHWSGTLKGAVDGGAADGEDFHEVSDGVLTGVVHAGELGLLAGGELGLLASELAFGAGDGHA